MKISGSSQKSFLKYNYRVDFLLLLARIFFPPTVLVFVLSLLDVVPKFMMSNPFLTILSHALVYVAYWTANVQYKQFRNEREAKSLGAILPVRLRGKWPGNIDVVVEYVRYF